MQQWLSKAGTPAYAKNACSLRRSSEHTRTLRGLCSGRAALASRAIGEQTFVKIAGSPSAFSWLLAAWKQKQLGSQARASFLIPVMPRIEHCDHSSKRASSRRNVGLSSILIHGLLLSLVRAQKGDYNHRSHLRRSSRTTAAGLHSPHY